MPDFTFAADEFVAAYDQLTLAGLRAAVRTDDPMGAIAISYVFDA